MRSMIYFSALNRTIVRPISSVPKTVLIVLVSALLLQVIWHTTRPPVTGEARALQGAPPIEALQLLGLGDSIALGKIVMLWLQAFDNQPGISIPFINLDYDKVIDWLDRILLLDARTQYPLFAASRVYSEVADEKKKRQMLEFVYEQFIVDPNRRWATMAHAVYVAKHRLKDLPLALKYARALAGNVTRKDIPYWVKQMEIYVLEDMGEIESAKILIGGLLESGSVSDLHELRFLEERLKRLEQAPDHGP